MTQMVTHMTSSHSSPSDMCIQPENCQSHPSPLLSPSYCDHTPKQPKFQLAKAKWTTTEEVAPIPACKVRTPHHPLFLPPPPPPPAHSRACLFAYINTHVLMAFFPHLI